MIKQLNSPAKEIILMSVKVGKWNKYNWCQERNFVITNSCLYNFNKKSKSADSHYYIELRRVILIKDLAGITKNI